MTLLTTRVTSECSVAPVVSLDQLPADVPAEYAPVMVAACNDVVTEGRCAMAADLPESTRPDAVGLVLWQGAGYEQVTLRVGRGNGQWVQRALTFSESDSIAERFTTVGLTVATLVGETEPPRDPEAAAPHADSKTASPPVAPLPLVSVARPSAAQPAARRVPARRPLMHAAVGGLTGPGWSGGGWQRGAFLSVGFRLPGLPVVFHGFGSYAESAGPDVVGVAAQSAWFTGGVGGGLIGTWDALAVSGSLALELAARRIHVERDAKSTSDSELPVRLRISGSFPAEGQVGFMLGALMRVPPRGGEASDAQRLRGPPIAVELLAGLEVRL